MGLEPSNRAVSYRACAVPVRFVGHYRSDPDRDKSIYRYRKLDQGVDKDCLCVTLDALGELCVTQLAGRATCDTARCRGGVDHVRDVPGQVEGDFSGRRKRQHLTYKRAL